MFSFLQFCDFTAGTLQAVCLPSLSQVCPSCDTLVCTTQYVFSGEFNKAVSKIVGAPGAQELVISNMAGLITKKIWWEVVSNFFSTRQTLQCFIKASRSLCVAVF